jgi:hypothetical protein
MVSDRYTVMCLPWLEHRSESGKKIYHVGKIFTATHDLYYLIVTTRKANLEKFSVEWQSEFVGPQNYST